MKHSTLIPALLAVACFLSALSRAGNIPLTEDGKPKAVIVLSAAVSPQDLSTRAVQILRTSRNADVRRYACDDQ